MEPIEYLRGLRRRWKIVAACVLVALGVGWVVTGSQESGPTEPTQMWEASTYLMPTTTSVSIRGGGGILTAARRVTLSEVSRRAADALNYDGEPSELAANVVAAPEEDSGLLKVTATAPSAYRARLIADTFSEQLLVVLRADTQQQINALEESITHLERQIARRDAREAAEAPTEEPVGDPRLDEERTDLQVSDSLDAQLTALNSSLSTLVASTTGHPAGFDIVEDAVAEEATPETSGGIEAPESRSLRLLIAAVLGLLLGVVIVLLLERLDTRIRSKEGAEASFRLPVLAEIPSIPRRRRRSVVAGLFPHAPASNAFRLLAAALQFGRHDGPTRPGGGDVAMGPGLRAGAGKTPETILVTSAVPGEGKSTVVANLAATFAEVGKRVIVLSCDFRHPTLHGTFGLAKGPGLAEVLEGDGAVDLESALQDAQLERIRVAATGFGGERTAALLGSERMRQLLVQARDGADVVLIDTAPVLSAGDWTQLLPEVDGVLVVARVGKTDASTADRVAETLAILQAPVVGVALNDTPRGSVRKNRYPYRYRRSRSRDEKQATAKVSPAPTAEGADAKPATEEVGVTSASKKAPSAPAPAPAPAPAVDGGSSAASGAAHGPVSDAKSGVRKGADRDGGIPHLVRPSSKE